MKDESFGSKGNCMQRTVMEWMQRNPLRDIDEILALKNFKPVLLKWNSREPDARKLLEGEKWKYVNKEKKVVNIFM